MRESFMTSHYMRCAVNASFDKVFEVLSGVFGNIYSKKLSKNEGSSRGVVLGEQYFFRVNSDVAVLIILEQLSPQNTQVETISCAGGTGMLEISYSAHASYVHDVRNLLSRSGFEVKVEEEISYFGRSSLSGPTPQSFLKKCVECGKEIPIASKECQYCGAKQPE